MTLVRCELSPFRSVPSLAGIVLYGDANALQEYSTCNGKTVSVGSSNCAIVTPTPTSTKAAGRYKRDMEERKLNAEKDRLCPSGQTACPIGLSIEGGYECVDTSEELESEFTILRATVNESSIPFNNYRVAFL